MQSTESATRLSGAHWPTLKTNLDFWTKIFVIQIYKKGKVEGFSQFRTHPA